MGNQPKIKFIGRMRCNCIVHGLTENQPLLIVGQTDDGTEILREGTKDETVILPNSCVIITDNYDE